MKKHSFHDDSETYFTTTELAALCGVTFPTITRAIKNGMIKSTTTPGGHNRILMSEAKKFMKTLGFKKLPGR